MSLPQAVTLPAAWYGDAEHHAREVAAVFRAGWSCVGVVDDVAAANTYAAVSVAGLPVLLTRAADGDLRGFLNVCRHRGAPLAEACGSARALGCPYHALGVPARRLAVARCRDGGRRGLRPRRPCAVPGERGNVGAVRVRASRPARRSVRPRPAGRGARCLPARRLRAGGARGAHPRVQLEGVRRELQRELPHPVRPPRVDRQRLGLPDRDAGRDQPGVGPSAPAAQRRRAGAGVGATGRGGLGRGRGQPDRRRVHRRRVRHRLPEPARERVPRGTCRRCT